MNRRLALTWVLAAAIGCAPAQPPTPKFVYPEARKGDHVEDYHGTKIGVELLEVSPYYSCCGFGGSFSMQQPQLSRRIGETYLDAVQATGAQGLVSLDSSCLLHLKGVAAARGWNLHFLHLAEFDFAPLKMGSAQNPLTKGGLAA